MDPFRRANARSFISANHYEYQNLSQGHGFRNVDARRLHRVHRTSFRSRCVSHRSKRCLARRMAQRIVGTSRPDASRDPTGREWSLSSEIFRAIRLGHPVRLSGNIDPKYRCQWQQRPDLVEEARASAWKLQHANLGIRIATPRFVPSSWRQWHHLDATYPLIPLGNSIIHP